MKKIHILYCNTCKDKIVLTGELTECNCKQVMGFIYKDGNPEIAGYNGALLSPDYDLLLNLPEYNQAMLDEDGIIVMNPLFEIKKEGDTLFSVTPHEVEAKIVPMPNTKPY